MGSGMMPPMMYTSNMQQFMPHMAMGMNQPPAYIPFPSQAHMAGVGPSYPPPRYPFPNIQTFDPSRIRLQSPQPNLVSNQPQMNPYSQFVGHHRIQQPRPPLQVILHQYPIVLIPLCPYERLQDPFLKKNVFIESNKTTGEFQPSK